MKTFVFSALNAISVDQCFMERREQNETNGDVSNRDMRFPADPGRDTRELVWTEGAVGRRGAGGSQGNGLSERSVLPQQQ